MIDHNVYWVWLQHAFGVGSPFPKKIFEEFPGGVKGFYEAGPSSWNALDYVSEQRAVALREFKLSAAQSRLEYAASMGWDVLTPECEKYPEALRNISDPPAVLYINGRMPDLNKTPAIGMAGAREATEESENAAKQIGYQLAVGGAVVVSGGAVGVDRYAIFGALLGMGRVVSVLPVDLSSPYLRENVDLRQKILDQGGALVTEYFAQRNPERGGFQVRNRLITGMSRGVVLVQVAKKSGSMIYSRHAADQARDLFVYPGPEGAPEYEGSRILLEKGAVPVTDGGQVLGAYENWTGYRPAPAKGKGARRVKTPPKPRTRKPEPIPMPKPAEPPVLALADIGLPTEPSMRALADSGLSKEPPTLGLPPEQQKAVDCLRTGEKTTGQLEVALGLPAGKLMALMTEMELDGLVESLPGKRFRLLRP